LQKSLEQLAVIWDPQVQKLFDYHTFTKLRVLTQQTGIERDPAGG
jgi:hypothetical protein